MDFIPVTSEVSPGLGFYESFSVPAGGLLAGSGVKGGVGGQQSPDQLDVDYILQGLGVYAWRRVRRVCRVVWWFLAVMVQWLDVRKQGGRGAVSANYVLKWLTWRMHCNYTVLKKISETCYPPSLFGKSLPELVYMGSTAWGGNSSYTRRS